MEYRRAWAEINLSNLAHNLTALRKYLHNTPIMGIVKADAYGHGAVPIAQTLVREGINSLGVAICEEGVQLREAGINIPILIMGFTPEPLLGDVIRQNLAQTVFSPVGARALATQASRFNKRAVVHIKIDTGMSRLGFLPNKESIDAICSIAEDPHLDIRGIYTHCATSDELDNTFMLEQQARFNWVMQELSQRGLHIMQKHMSNSGAFSQTLRGFGNNGDVCNDGLFMDTVRLGILLYGYPPSAEMAEVCKILELKPLMRLMTQVSMVKQLPANVGISYGHIYKTTCESIIAVLPVGYADGYPRRLSYGGKVLVKNQLAPIAGAICMDQCMADVTHINKNKEVKTGDPVVMLGTPEEKISADDLANIVGTISYEILCGIGKRVPRVYTI